MDRLEVKSRGAKHVKDKRKYKGNTTKNPKYVPPKNVPRLGSNWDRYVREEENEGEHKLSTSTNYRLLANAPFSFGTHFQFKRDKVTESPSFKEVGNSHLFSLNLDLLSRSVLTIPFYERMGIGKENFMASDLKSMDENASKSDAAYKTFVQTSLNEHYPKADIVGNQQTLNSPILPQNSLSASMEKKETGDSNSSVSEEESILEMIDNCTLAEATAEAVPSEPKEELEQWLDDILED